MRKTFVLWILILLGAGARLALAAGCPGVSACVPNSGCPRGSIRISPGQSIQTAINSAPVTGAVLCVAPGTYKGLLNFRGKPIHLVSSGGPLVTFLDGGGSGPVVSFKTGEGKASILNGFTIRNGRALNGAGIFIQGASPTIRNSILTGNKAVGGNARGGGIAVTGAQAHPAILCTQFLGNTADFSGGGLMSTYSATPYLRSNLFQGNSAPYGGGIGVHWSGRLDIGWTQLLANRAIVDGGGIHVGVTSSYAQVRQVWFKGNTAASQGGGMWVPAGFATVLNSTFEGNQANNGGAIAAGYGSMVDVASSLFIRNTSADAVLVNTPPGSNTSLVNHYNGFFGNSSQDHSGTYGDKDLLFLTGDPLGGSCCPTAGSQPINAGIPDYHFNDPDGTRNDMGACGGPDLATYGIMK